jgi:hypothetical protein
MSSVTIKRAWQRGILGCLLALICSGPVIAQEIHASSLGRIEALSLETGQVVIEGRIYSLEMSDLTVVHKERILDPGVLRPGMDIAFGVGRSSAGSGSVIRTVKILSPSASLGLDD